MYLKTEKKIIPLRNTKEYKDALSNLPFDYLKLGKIAVNYSLFFYFFESLECKKSQISLEDAILLSSPIWSN